MTREATLPQSSERSKGSVFRAIVGGIWAFNAFIVTVATPLRLHWLALGLLYLLPLAYGLLMVSAESIGLEKREENPVFRLRGGIYQAFMLLGSIGFTLAAIALAGNHDPLALTSLTLEFVCLTAYGVAHFYGKVEGRLASYSVLGLMANLFIALWAIGLA